MRRTALRLVAFLAFLGDAEAQEFWRWSDPNVMRTFRSVTPQCHPTNRIGSRGGPGACANELFYIEWSRTAGGLGWLRQGSSEVVALLNGDASLPRNMLSGVELPETVGWPLQDSVAFSLVGPTGGFCVFGFSVPRAADEYSSLADNPLSRIERGTPPPRREMTAFFLRQPFETFDFTEDQSRRVIRCAFGGEHFGAILDFFPYGGNATDYLVASVQVLVPSFND